MNYHKTFNRKKQFISILASAKTPLKEKLYLLRDQLAKAAQEVYDDWELDEDGLSWQVGGGGICHLIADAMADVVFEKLEVECSPFSFSIGEVHVALAVSDGEEHYMIDINPYIYEEGSGYSWQKIPGVIFEPEDVTVYPIDEFPEEW